MAAIINFKTFTHCGSGTGRRAVSLALLLLTAGSLQFYGPVLELHARSIYTLNA